MNLLSGKKILLGISGGIAAYKTPLIVRQLVKYGAEVRVVMTPDSKDFVTPLTLSTLTKNPVLSSFTATDLDNPIWNDHVELALWSDIYLIAPATSKTISSMAHGICNNLLLAVYFSSKSPVFIAPAMDLDMYAHPSNKKNISILKSYGNNVLPVGEGQLASGLEGKGRMLEPEEIINSIISFFHPKQSLKNQTVLITAGPTYESLDPVRFIGNNSSGKMGFSLARIASDLGAKVILISGPTNEYINLPLVELHRVTTSDEMFQTLKLYYTKANIVIAAAAVSDFKPRYFNKHKIKKGENEIMLKLEPTIDILSYMGKNKINQRLIGFALETEHEIENAIRKIKNKNLDGIVLNSLNDDGSGFSFDTNKITFIRGNDFKIKSYPLKSKLECAKIIFDQILSL